MSTISNKPANPNPLLTAAEAQFARAELKDACRPSDELLQELRVYQIELEMQNDELRRTQKDLEETRDRYLNLYDFAPLGYLTLIGEAKISEVNLTAAALLGVERKKLLKRRFADFVVPEDHERWRQYFLRVAQHGDKQDCELMLMRGDGSRFHVHLDCLRVESDDEHPPVRIAFTDITERKKNEDVLRLHSEILGNLSEGIFLIRVSDGTIVFTNPQFERMFGYGSGELVGKHVSIINAPGANSPEATAAEIMSALAQTGMWSGEVHNIRKDGTTFWCHANVSAFDHSQFGKVWVAVHEDITEHKQIEEALIESEESYRMVFESSRDAIMTASAEEGFLSGNAAAVALFGCRDEQEFITLSPALTSPEFQSDGRRSDDKAQEMMRIALETGSNFFEWTHKRMDGTEFAADVLLTRMEIGGKKLIQATVRDITERKKAKDELRIAAIAFESQEGIIVTDANGVIMRANQAFTRLTGYSTEEIVGQTPAVLNSGRHGKEFFEGMWATLKQKRQWQGEIWNRRKNGKIYAEWLNISAVTAPDGSITHYVGTFSNITHDPEASAEIHRLAYYDPLTHLPNRRLLMDRLGQALAGSQRSGRYGALLFMDLDNFKKLNDTRGHDVGDLLLIEIAKRLNACVREGDTVVRLGDTVVRLGGDEFVLMLENLGEDVQAAAIQAGHVGEKLREAIAMPYMLDGVEFTCTVSIGISLFFGHDESVDNLLKYADIAMYHAKKGGRNRLSFFDPAMQATLVEHNALENDLRHALAREQLHLHYQIQIDSEHRVVGAEALLRWYHPERGLIYPNKFIPLAEETGLIIPIGMWALQKACAQLREWSANPATRELQLSVNVSVRQFHQPDFVAQVQQALATTGINPERLKIELTESLVLNDVSDTITKMHAIKKLGVSFSMDDFGTGYSSLSNLQQLPLNQLKIDQSFIRDLATNPNDAAIVQAIVTMGRSFGLNVIAEGVETKAQREFLNLYGCHAFQGYLFNKPMPIKEFETLITQYA